MKGCILLVALAFAALLPSNLFAGPITKHDDPLVKEIEGRYVTFADAAHRGDMKTFRSLRTAKVRISDHDDHPFRSMVTSCFGAWLPVISV
jgi:hypothetical protein